MRIDNFGNWPRRLLLVISPNRIRNAMFGDGALAQTDYPSYAKQLSLPLLLTQGFVGLLTG